MKDNTYKPLLLVTLVIVLLLLLHFLPPMTVFGMKLKQINILSQIITLPGDETAAAVVPKTKDPKAIMAHSKSGQLIHFKETWPKGTEPILDYSEGRAGGMDHFYAMLDSVARRQLKGRPLRIAYFGDSFIEGDILVGDLREMLQNKYGGGGIGWVDAGNDLEQYRRSVKSTFTGMTEYMVKKKPYDATKAGIAERYYTTNGNATLSIKGSKLYPHTLSWTNTRFYFKSSRSVTISGTADGGASFSQWFGGSRSLQALNHPGTTQSISLKFHGSPILYGAALESDGGVTVDNFSMRGSNGRTLANIPDAMLRDFDRLRTYDLIVLQFGVNAVTATSTDDDMKRYVGHMRAVISHFRECFPEASILVVSTPDHGSKDGGQTMSTIKVLEGYQKQLAADEHVGFYSLFKAMGGDGAMARLHERGMCSADFIHVSYSGGRFIAQQVFKSIVAGESNYKRRKQLEQK